MPKKITLPRTPLITVNNSSIDPARVWFAALPVNTRNEPGKIGIRYHNRFFALFYRTIPITNQFGKKYYLKKHWMTKLSNQY